MQVRRDLLAGFAAFALLGSVAAAQSAHSANRMSSDSRFITEAAQGGMAEVKMGQLAVQKAADPGVKQFGQRMIDDHTKANNELKTIASRAGVTLPAEVSAKQKATCDRLSKLSGAEFDRAYMQTMVADHKEDVAEFKKEADNGADPEVKAFATKTLPTLQEHLRMAEETQSQLKK